MARQRGAAAAVLWCAAVLCAVVVAILAVDRPVAIWAHATFAGDGPGHALLPLLIGLTHLVDPLGPLAALALLGCGLARLGRLDPSLPRALPVVAVTTLSAAAIKDQLKFAFGRLWPETWVNNNPSFIHDGAYGFVPFHGGSGWSSFPSGHMAVVAAPAVALMLAAPRWAPALALPIILVAAGLVGADYHFVSDVVAGTAVGAACAVLCDATFGRPRPTRRP